LELNPCREIHSGLSPSLHERGLYLRQESAGLTQGDNFKGFAMWPDVFMRLFQAFPVPGRQ
jgi:hypothetical protein